MLFFEIIKAILFGIVEGITEWLPISSTAHMLILNDFLPLNFSEEFYSVFETVIQLGAILAAVIVLWKKIWPFGMKVKRKNGTKGFGIRMNVFFMWINVVITCVPVGIVGVLFDDKIDALFASHQLLWVSMSLILFGAAFIVVEGMREGKKPTVKSLYKITPVQAVGIGLFQVVAAILPGASRSGMTIIGALLMGISRPAATEYTFTTAIPVMAGVSLLRLLKHGFDFTASELVVLGVACAVAFAVSMVVIRRILAYIKTHSFKAFGWYRVIFGAAVLGYYMIFKM